MVCRRQLKSRLCRVAEMSLDLRIFFRGKPSRLFPHKTARCLFSNLFWLPLHRLLSLVRSMCTTISTTIHPVEVLTRISARFREEPERRCFIWCAFQMARLFGWEERLLRTRATSIPNIQFFCWSPDESPIKINDL